MMEKAEIPVISCSGFSDVPGFSSFFSVFGVSLMESNVLILLTAFSLLSEFIVATLKSLALVFEI